jgi:hypothetical protein
LFTRKRESDESYQHWHVALGDFSDPDWLGSLLKLNFEGMQYVTGGLAIAVGICLLINK